MGRPPSNGVPSFRFNSVEVAEMDTILHAHNFAMPSREVLEALAEKFSLSAERSGKFVVQMKQVWHWFQNRRYALRAKAARAPETLNLSPVTQDDSSIVNYMPQAPQSKPSLQDTTIDVPEAPQSLLAPGSTGRNGADSNSMEFEAKSARDGAWYDVAMFLSHRSVEAVDPEVLVRFAGFGAEEDEWVDIGRLVRKRSLPCESSECVAVLQGDLILCFQEGKEQALYYDAHVLDAQRRRHDVRGCRCRFLVRYDHDQSEEIVPLRKICRRPETDYRLQQLYASNDSATTNQSKAGAVPRTDNSLRVYPPAEPMQKQPKIEDFSDVVPVLPGASQTKLLAGTEIQAQQTKVADIIDAGTPGNSSAPQNNISPQPQVMKIVSPSTMEISDASIVVQQPEVTEAQQTKVADIIDAGTPGHSSAPQNNNPPQPQLMKISSPGTMEISDASIVVQQPGVTEAQQTKVADIIDADTSGNSSAPQSNNSPQPQVMKIVSPGTMEISDASLVVPQPEVTEIINGEDLESLNVKPSIAIQQQKVTEIVSDANHGNSHVPPVDVVPQSEVDETSGSLESANIPPVQ